MEENKVIDVDFKEVNENQNENDTMDEKKSIVEIMKDLQSQIKSVRGMIKQVEMIYNQLKTEFKFDFSQMNKIRIINNDWIKNNFSEVEIIPDDKKFGGIDTITEEQAIEIFGEDSPIIMPTFIDLTHDRIKSCFETWLQLDELSKEYRKITDEYSILVDEAQKQQIEMLKEAASNENDIGKKAILNKAINDYEDGVSLKWLSNKLTDKEIERIKSTANDEKRLKYIVDKAMKKMDSLNIARQFILQLNGFEKTYLDEKYFDNNGYLAIHIIEVIAFSDVYDKNIKLKITVTALMIDKLMRKLITDEEREKILTNIKLFEDQLL